MSNWMVREFPNLSSTPFRVASPKTPAYNCIAWAAGETHRCWWPDKFRSYYWPVGIPRRSTLEAFLLAFETLDFVPCEHGDWEDGFEKIVIFADQGKPTHAARQLSAATWSSKLGKEEDIEHTTDGLEGGSYGSTAVFMKRSIA